MKATKPKHIAVPLESVSIDHETRPLVEFLQQYKSDFASLRKSLADRDHLWLSYEDDLSSDPTGTARRCFEFLGMPAFDVTTRYGRTNPFPLHGMITNYTELEDHLAGTPFEWMLKD